MVTPEITADGKRSARGRALMWLVAALGGSAVHILLWEFSEPSALFSDFFKANWPAAGFLWDDGWNADWPLTEKGGFSNLPSIGWLYVPLIPLGEDLAPWVWLGLGLAALLGGCVLLTRLARLDGPMSAALLFCFLANGPIVNSLREGQTSHFILFFLAATLALWRAKREYAAGLALGLCAAIKLPLVFLCAYVLFRRRWRIVAGAATVIGIVVVSSLAQFGSDGLVGWYKEWVEPYLAGYIPAFNVQSIDGFLVRLAKGETFLRHWDPPLAPPLWHRIARACAFAALFGSVIWLVWRGSRLRPAAAAVQGPSERELLEFSLVTNLALVTSPISWTHYYVFLLVPWALYLGRQLPLPDDAATRWLMRAGYFATALPIVMWASEQPSWYNAVLSRTLVSVCLLGGLLMFAALARGAWRAPIAHPSSQASPA
ncbi:MAG TPA: glycosyltransferase family 87 protein [Alphaproteobacteria bacterium]|jgi:hypothetical protein